MTKFDEALAALVNKAAPDDPALLADAVLDVCDVHLGQMRKQVTRIAELEAEVAEFREEFTGRTGPSVGNWTE